MSSQADGGPAPAGPSVRLRPMTAEEFTAWYPWAEQDYAREIALERHVPLARARERTARWMAQVLVDGVETADHRIEVAEADGVDGRVGYLWFAPKETDAGLVCWLYDLWVDEPHRGHGYGRAMMHALLDEARAGGLTRIELNAFAGNRRAGSLYASLGFVEMSRQYYLDL